MEAVLTNTVCKQGWFKKVKPKLQMKYFVLHKDGRPEDQLARLEYYDTVKKWESKKKPKRVIFLRQCFSVNEFSNGKVDHGLALYTKDDCFQGSFNDAEERDSWLLTIKALINTHRDARPMFEHVWNVKIRERDLGKTYEGEYRLCLNNRTVIFVKKAEVDPSLDFPLEVIRRCGHSANFFNLEVGRQASTGPGEFWMEVDDRLIAENVHHAIIAVMNVPKEDDLRPKSSGHSRSSGEPSRRGDRNRGSKAKSIQPSTMSNGERGRSDSIDSRSMTSKGLGASIPSLNSEGAVKAASESLYNGPGSSVPDSRSSTPVRSLTPDPRLSNARVSDAGLTADTSYLPYNISQTQDVRSGSISSTSMSSWANGREPAPAVSTGHSSVGYGNGSTGYNSNIVLPGDDSSYAAMTPSGLSSSEFMGEPDSYLSMTPGESLPTNANLPINKKPLRTQSFMSGNLDPHPHRLELTPAPALNDSAYLDMAPTSSASASAYLDMTPTSSAPDPAYLDMAPTSSASDSAYLDMAPTSSAPDSAYLDMAPTSSTKDAPYLDMAPASTVGDSPYLDMAPASSGKDGAYIDMTPVSTAAHPTSSANESLYFEMVPAGAGADAPYLDMTPNSSTSDINKIRSSPAYMDMRPTGVRSRTNSLQLSTGALINSKTPYIDMSGKDGNKDGNLRRMDSVRSYLSSNENVADDVPIRHYSVGSKPLALKKPPNPDQYVEMRRSTDLANKSLSVPHLMPLSLASNPDLTHLKEEYPSQYPPKSNTLVILNQERPRTSSESFKQRPRGATWSTNVRPATSSRGHKHRLSTKSNSSRESVQSTCSEYIDMGVGRCNELGGTYVDMAPSNHHQRVGSIGSASGRLRRDSQTGLDSSQSSKLAAKLSPPKSSRSGNTSPGSRTGTAGFGSQSDSISVDGGVISDDVLRNPHLGYIGRRFSQPYKPIDPFPELSASSEDELGGRSAASSFSSTRSSSSSRSSLARQEIKTSHMYGGGAQMDPESYVECQHVPMISGANKSSSYLHSHPKINKPTRVASFISEEPPASTNVRPSSVDKKGVKEETDPYFVMSPLASTKQSGKQSNATSSKAKPTQSSSKTGTNTTPSDKSKRQSSVKPQQLQSTSSPKAQPKTVRSVLQHVQNKIAKVQQQAKGKPATEEKIGSGLYVDMAPSQPPLPQPAKSSQAPPRPEPAPDTYTTMSPLSHEDPYIITEAATPKSVSLVRSTDRNVDTTSEGTPSTLSEASHITSAGKNSGHVVFHDSQVSNAPPTIAAVLNNQNSTVYKPRKAPKSVPCYIRQNSRDIRIYPSPAVPAACYIRSESNLSTHSDFSGNVSPTGFLHDDILADLASATTASMQLNFEDGNIASSTRHGGHDVSSPGRRPSTPTDNSLPSSESSTSTIPCSAAELQLQLNRKLEPTEEERETGGSSGRSKGITGSGRESGAMKSKEEVIGNRDSSRGKEGSGGSRGKDGGSNGSSGKEGSGGAHITPVKSFIIDDTPTLVSRTGRGRAGAPPPPPIPVRLVSTEDKSNRYSSATESSPITPGPLNYVDIEINNDDHSNSTGSSGTNTSTIGASGICGSTAITGTNINPSTSPKSGSGDQQMAKPPSTIDYTTIDPEKTMELSKKNTTVH